MLPAPPPQSLSGRPAKDALHQCLWTRRSHPPCCVSGPPCDDDMQSPTEDTVLLLSFMLKMFHKFSCFMLTDTGRSTPCSVRHVRLWWLGGCLAAVKYYYSPTPCLPDPPKHLTSAAHSAVSDIPLYRAPCFPVLICVLFL